MRPAAHSLAAIILTILCTVAVRPQSLSIYNVDVRNFPVMKATMLAFNPDGSKAQPVISNLMLKENGVQRTITDVQCTPVQGNIPLSPVLTIDLSASMAGGNGSETNLDIAKAFATAFVNRLPLGTGSKCAITTFSDTNTLNSPFTASGSALLSVIGALQPAGGTNYDAAFLDAPAGALRVTGVGNNKRMIILVADGTPNTLPVVSTILKEAARLNTQIHCIMIGITAPQWLNDISVKTGGVVFNNITNSTQARMAAYELVTLAQGGTHCELTWQTEAPCMILPTDVSVLWGTTADTVTYTPPFRVLAELRCTPAFVAFGRRTLTGSYDTAITLEARNSAIRVLDIKPKIATAAFSILENFPLDIPSGGKRTIMIRYFATDSVKRYAAFDIVTDKCPATFSVNAGYIQGKQKTLEITRPAGGETYIAGNAMEIEWRGIAASDTVTLLYS
ncbi:MAG: VWA domain-containing protein, partial [Candidatus Kapabacteria bacterium]|nr:VWA domain-containing protein [Candidatus Kapabacteria bacterium]